MSIFPSVSSPTIINILVCCLVSGVGEATKSYNELRIDSLNRFFTKIPEAFELWGDPRRRKLLTRKKGGL